MCQNWSCDRSYQINVREKVGDRLIKYFEARFFSESIDAQLY
ncbi:MULTISPECIES: hypothetical protein [Nostocaceae]|nr:MULTISPECIES: hypothetical protein [Nostocaceae]